MFSFFLSLAVQDLGCSTWELQFFIAACGISDQGSNPVPLHWEQEDLATGPPGKSQKCFLFCSFYLIFANATWPSYMKLVSVWPKWSNTGNFIWSNLFVILK